MPGTPRTWAAILSPDFIIEGQPWVLQDPLPTTIGAAADIAALGDGSFAYVWTAADAVHLRRYIGADMPLVSDVADEAPWGPMTGPVWPRIATVDNRVGVVWVTLVNNQYKIRGQVLAY